jgi:predicted RNase H-like nuclease (RuvC/YqgF family)
LRSRVEGHSSENAVTSKKRDERLDEIASLKAELMRERNRNDVAAVTKKVTRLEKERKDQDQTIGALNKAIDAFKSRMTQYEAEKLTLSDENEVVKKKEQFGEVVLKKEIETLKNKITLVESSRDKKNEEIKTLKVRVSEL